MNEMNHAIQLKIICWNANGLPQRKLELENFLQHHNIDIALIAETHLVTSANLPKIRNYLVYATNHPSGLPRGGSAVIIKRSLPHHDIGSFCTDSIQSSVIAINFNHRSINISSIYCPPRHTPLESDFTDLFNHLGHHWILGGDFNAKHPAWGSRLQSPRGKVLHKAITRVNGNPITPGNPTYWPSDFNKIPDIIDFFVCKGVPINNIISDTVTDLGSDHIPVTLTLNNLPVLRPTPRPLANNSTNWDEYRNSIDQQINLSIRIVSPEDLDQCAEQFTSILQQSCENSTVYRDLIPSPTVDYPKFIMELIKRRRRARKKWQRNRTIENKQTFNRLCRETARAMHLWKNETFEKYLTALAPTKEAGYSLWTASKRIRRPPTLSSPLRSSTGNWVRSDRDKARLFAEHFEKTFSPNTIHSNITPSDIVLDAGKIRTTSPTEVAAVIDHLKLRKSPGYDRISPIMLKELSRKGIVFITRLINVAIRLRYVPRSWKRAKMIIIPKPDKPPDLINSYRPISLLSIISKIFEKIIQTRLNEIIREKNLLPSVQFGFRAKHSTIEQINRVSSAILQALENKEFAPTVFLDVSSAFDKVWHKGLIHKLRGKIPDCFRLLIASYLSDRSFEVHIGSESSELKPITAGVPQGSILGPVLYLLYTMDFPQEEGVTSALYADDSAAIAHHQNYDAAVAKLQNAVDGIQAWAQDWKIKLNDSKSVRIDFSLRPHGYTPTIIGGKSAPYAENTRYLGLHLDSKLNWRHHVYIKRQQLDILLRKFYWLVGRHSKLKLCNKKLIYESIFKPIWMYGCELWGTTSDSNRKIIDRFQNKFMRAITSAPWYVTNGQLRSDLGLDPIEIAIKKKATKYTERLHEHPNIEAITLLDNTNTTRRLRRRHPLDLIN